MADFGTYVLDGAVDPARYNIAPKRILWMLREVNDPERNIKDLRNDLKSFADERSIHLLWTRTFGPVARISYGLLNPDDPWTRWCNEPSVFSPALAQIAVINVKKSAGGATARWSELRNHFAVNEPMLKEQVRELNPDVVIGGNILWLCRDWLAPWLPRFGHRDEPFPARLVGGAIWVHAYHPSHRGYHERYFQRIAQGIARATPASSY